MAMPLSLVGAFFIMLVLGYSINLLTLLALVLAIGLVVDDAIIIVENVDRHLKLGATPLHASIAAARELAGPIIAISVVLIAVYVPIGFQGGLTGIMFSEFAFTLAGAVAISAVIALTLSPMMCARFLKSEHGNNALVQRIDSYFNWLTSHYHAVLRRMLESWRAVVAFGAAIIVLIAVMMAVPMPFGAMRELAPPEDQGFIFYLLTAAPNATPEQVGLYSHQVFESMRSLPEYENAFQFDGYPSLNGGFGGIVVKAYEERHRKIPEILADLQNRVNRIAGAKVVCINPPSLPGNSGGYPIQFVIKTTAPFQQLHEVSQAFVAKAQATGKFWVVEPDLKIDKAQTRIMVDYDKAAAMGLSNRDIGGALGGMLGGGYANYFSIAGRSYKVMPQIRQPERLNAEQISNYYLRTPGGAMIPASTLLSLKTETVPESINHFQQLNSATINAVYAGTQGDALNLLGNIAKEVLPHDYSIDYGGESRQYMQESGGFMKTLVFALIIIFLTLAAQFESFRDPVVILMSVPMAIFGAMIFIFEGFATLNIYTQVGLVTLLGLIAKHGILIVQFANDLQAQGMPKRQAIEEAAAIRLRPILMTTAAMALGVIPLVVANGAGAVGRNHMGLVIAAGISIGTLFTLFVVPAVYLGIARDHTADRKADDAIPVPEQA
jgi:multidrug efflux pump